MPLIHSSQILLKDCYRVMHDIGLRYILTKQLLNLKEQVCNTLTLVPVLYLSELML